MAPHFPRLHTLPPRSARYAAFAGAAIVLAVYLLLAYLAREQARRERWSRIAAVNHAYPVIASVNYDDRSDPLGVDCIVVHATATESVPKTIRTLTLPIDRHVSAHFLVDKQGRVLRLVPIERRAWHAGISALNGREHVNDFSVGIEIMNRSDGRDPYTDAQYKAVALLIRRLRTCYDVPDTRIVSHAAVALPKGRKSDPVGFDWPRLRRLLR